MCSTVIMKEIKFIITILQTKKTAQVNSSKLIPNTLHNNSTDFKVNECLKYPQIIFVLVSPALYQYPVHITVHMGTVDG